MKNFVALLLVLSLLTSCFLALAEDTGVQMIGGPERPAETVNLDDFKGRTNGGYSRIWRSDTGFCGFQRLYSKQQ